MANNIHFRHYSTIPEDKRHAHLCSQAILCFWSRGSRRTAYSILVCSPSFLMFWRAINIYYRCYLAITKDERLACLHSQAIQCFWSRGIFRTLSRLESALKPKSAYGISSVWLGSELASTMAPSRFRVGVAATLVTRSCLGLQKMDCESCFQSWYISATYIFLVPDPNPLGPHLDGVQQVFFALDRESDSETTAGVIQTTWDEKAGDDTTAGLMVAQFEVEGWGDARAVW